MIAILSRRVIWAIALLVLPGLGVAQDSATEPPVPRAAPVTPVVEEVLPRVGGVLFFGGTSGTGLETVRELVKRGEKVTAVARATSDTAELKALGVNILTGDALVAEDVERAFNAAPFRIVVSTLGGRRGNYLPDYEGNRRVIDAAKAAGIPRMVLVTAIGAGDSEGAEPWYFGPFMEQYMAEKTKAEDYLQKSGLEFTIIRPGWLLDRAPSGKSFLSSDRGKFSWIARRDLAVLVADCTKGNVHVNQVLTAYDSSRDHFWELLF